MLGVVAACVWLLSAILGFQQFGLPTVLFGLALAYSGAALYAWRVMEDRRRAGLPLIAQTLHVKLTGAMLFVLVLDGVGYLMAVNTRAGGHTRRSIAVLEDIFVAVALLTISVGLVLPGMITYSATGGQRGRQAPDLGHAARLLAAPCARSAAATSTRRTPRSTSCRSSPTRATSSARWPRASTCCRRRCATRRSASTRRARTCAPRAPSCSPATHRSPISPITTR